MKYIGNLPSFFYIHVWRLYVIYIWHCICIDKWYISNQFTYSTVILHNTYVQKQMVYYLNYHYRSLAYQNWYKKAIWLQHMSVSGNKYLFTVKWMYLYEYCITINIVVCEVEVWDKKTINLIGQAIKINKYTFQTK